MNQEVRDKILSRPRAEELKNLEPWEPSLDQLRQRYGHSTSDEDLILMSIVGDDSLDIVGSSTNNSFYLEKPRPLTELIRHLAKDDKHRFISVSKGEFSLKMVKEISKN